jgi:hypothetical protein
MDNRNIIQDELKALDSSLPASPDSLSFSVPDGYFEGLAASVMARIKSSESTAAEEIAQISPLLAGISRTMPFTVPDHYFTENLESLSAVVGAEPVSELLSPAGKSMPFSLPEGYFDGLGTQVLDRVERPRAKVISMGSHKWMRWAAAAMIAGVVTISGISYFGSSNKAQVTVDNPQWVATNLKNVSAKDIDEFVRAADVTASSSVTAQNKGVKNNDVKKLLQDVSTKDLDAFLEQVPAEDEELAIN